MEAFVGYKMSIIEKYYSKNKFRENNVFKFNKSEYDATYDIAKSAFRIVGLRLTQNDPPLRKFIWNVFYLFECVNVCVAMLLELINMALTAADGSFIDLFTMLPCAGYLLLGMVKSYKIVYYRPVYENLISELRDMWPQDVVTEEEYHIVRNALTKLRRIVKGYYYCNITLVIFFSSPPFITLIRHMIGEEVPMSLSFSYWFPFNPYRHGRIEFIMLIQAWHCFITVCFILCGDLLFCIFLSHITTQFDLLGNRIKKMFYVLKDNQFIEEYPLGKNSIQYTTIDEESSNYNDCGTVYQKKIVDLILRHCALIRLSGDVETLFTFPLLINFVNSSIIICFCGFCSVFVEKWNEMNYKLFLTTATLQIWLLCWYGQRLIDSSRGVSDAVYSSGWYNVPKNIRSSLVILLYRAQKVVSVTTYGFSIISMASYSAILKTSWSYLMLLVNVFKQ